MSYRQTAPQFSRLFGLRRQQATRTVSEGHLFVVKCVGGGTIGLGHPCRQAKGGADGTEQF